MRRAGRIKPASPVLEEFEAAPWLLPPRTPAFPYAGATDFDELLALRAQPAGNHSSAVAILLFNKNWAAMSQNSIYSLVKHGGVRNYVVIVWTGPDLEACQDLNLPCADVRSMLLEPLSGKPADRARDFLLMAWVKPAVVLRALEAGHAVMVADTDVAYSVKPVWDSYLEYIEQNDGDGAWLEERPALNSGQFVLVPTPASLAFARAWVAAGPRSLEDKTSDQIALKALEGKHFQRCNNPCRCLRAGWDLTQHAQRERTAVFRTYLPSHMLYSPNWCTVGSAEWVPRMDPCDWNVLYVHPICSLGANPEEDLRIKTRVLQAAGFWFMDTEEGCAPHPDAASGVPACKPLHWRDPGAEAAHYACPSFGLALVHGGEPAAVVNARRAARGELPAKEAERLFDLDRNKKC